MCGHYSRAREKEANSEGAKRRLFGAWNPQRLARAGRVLWVRQVTVEMPSWAFVGLQELGMDGVCQDAMCQSHMLTTLPHPSGV